MSRTDEEILARIAERKEADFFGFEITDLIIRLPFDKARPFLKDGSPEADWVQAPRDRESVLAEMLEYMPFAWEKANGFRGISAGRSLCHYAAWVWLAGDDLGDFVRHYEFYGKPELLRICEHYGWDASQWDDGVRANEEPG